MSPSNLWLEDFRHEARKNMHLPDGSERSERSARILGSCEAHRLEAPILGVIAQNRHLRHDQSAPFVSCRFLLLLELKGGRNLFDETGWWVGASAVFLFATFHHFCVFETVFVAAEAKQTGTLLEIGLTRWRTRREH